MAPSLLDESVDVDGLSVGLLGARASNLGGLQLSFFYAQVDAVLRGLQLSTGFNFVDLQLRGVQITGIGNFAADVQGVQAAIGFNVARRLRGMQIALANEAKSSDGVQLGAFNSALRLQGARIGLINCSDEMVGAEIGLINASRETHGVQIGLVNIPGDVAFAHCSDVASDGGQIHGLQIGGINVGDQGSGLRLGLVNIAARTQGLQIGLLNVIAQANGESAALLNLVGDGIHGFAVYASETLLSTFELKFGGHHLYTAVLIGYRPGDAPVAGQTTFARWTRRYGFGFGAGWRIPLQVGRLNALEIETTVTELYESLTEGRHSQPRVGALRLVACVRILPVLQILAGISANLGISQNRQTAGLGTGVVEVTVDAHSPTVIIYPGLVLGFQI